jgi:hypothetical protein
MFLKSSLQGRQNMGTIGQQRTEDAMKDAVKTLLAGNARSAMEDTAGLVALFVVMFAVLSLPSLT